MASQIYARYVPPTKKKSSSTLPSVNVPQITPAFDSPVFTPPATRKDASSTYSRYVPSSRKKPADAIPGETPPVDSQSSPSSKRKHAKSEGPSEEISKKKRKKKHADNSENPPSDEPTKPRATLIPAADYYEPEKEKKKKKKETKKGKGDETPTETQATEPDAEEPSTPKSKKKKKNDGTSVDSKSLTSGGNEEEEDEEDSDEDDAIRHKRLLRKRERSIKKAKKLALKEGADTATKIPDNPPPPPEEEELHDLVPLPQPEPVPEPPSASITASLPPWLATPIRVPPTSTSNFEDLGLSKEIASALQEKGFTEALAVQAAVLPLLLPGKSQQPGDVLVSAATGSGKTLAYVLPMMESISRSRHLGIQGLIIVPTRELVTQARQVCEVCSSVFAKIGGYPHRPDIGTAVGNETLKAEQEALMGEELIFDPPGYEAEVKAANAPWEDSDQPQVERVMFPQQEFKSRLPGHVIRTFVKTDVLICTPGRLVEHLKSTPGFSLQHVRWLVVDEADKLLDQSFQQWLEIVMGQIHSSKRNIRDRVRKIVLSATMTSDIGQLTSLKLHRPKLVVLEGSSSDGTESAHQLAIPALLKESGVKIEDDIIKPLYLIELLKRIRLIPTIQTDESATSDSDSSDPDSDSDSDSDGSSDTSSSDSGSDSASSVNSAISQEMPTRPISTESSVLTFTKSNETAVRLGRLIALLCPGVSSKIGTLTSTTPRQSRQRTISSFSAGKITILVASDLVSRGLDLPNLAHVINYDVPTSLTSYIHRIGRTARAGKEGHAWTLFTATEAGWFWREIARNEKVQRVDGAKVERINIKKEIFDEERQRYEDALEVLEKEATSRTGKQDV